MTVYEGGCHCGNVRYQYCTEQPPSDWSVRRCTCTYCLRLAARYTSGPGTSLRVTVLYASMIQRYEFGTRTADFLRCNRCGVMVFACSGKGDNCIAVLNINTLDDVETLPVQVQPADFEGEEVADRLARRQANWIKTVSIEYVNA